MDRNCGIKAVLWIRINRKDGKTSLRQAGAMEQETSALKIEGPQVSWKLFVPF
jgi:hypothetical protein